MDESASPSSFSRRVTLKDVAARSGFSVATVSLALRDHARISPATRDRVKSMAHELGYAPDPALSALAAYRNRIKSTPGFSVIGLVSNWSSEDAWTRLGSAQQVIAGATERARELGYTLQHFWARADGIKPGRFDQILQTRGIRGLILAPFENPKAKFPLDWSSYSVVTIERTSHYGRFHHVVPNHYSGLLQCWQKLRGRGFTRVGLVVRGDLTERWSHQWEAAHHYAQAQEAAQLNFVPSLEVTGNDPVGLIRNWLRRYQPQAVINRCDHFFQAAALEGLRIPEDVGYVSLNVADDIPHATGIDQYRALMGATSVDILNTLLQRNQRGFQPSAIGTQVDGAWCDGRTLGPRSPSKRAPKRQPSH